MNHCLNLLVIIIALIISLKCIFYNLNEKILISNKNKLEEIEAKTQIELSKIEDEKQALINKTKKEVERLKLKREQIQEQYNEEIRIMKEEIANLKKNHNFKSK